jgi:hypothetical protein
MLNALRARNPLYRGLLAYFLFMSRQSRGVQWAIIISAYVVFRVIRWVNKERPDLHAFTIPIIAVYVLFVLFTWAGPSLFNLFLRFDRFGRHVLKPDEVLGANLVGLALGLAVLLGLAALWLQSAPLGLAGLLFLLMIVPIGGTFNADAGPDRLKLGVYTSVLLALGLLGVILLVVRPEAALLPGVLFGLGLFGFGWVANALATRKPA